VYLPPLQAMHDSQVFISGDVTIDPSAAIAPGVLLQASGESSIIIAAGVCIGMGAVLHACDGTLEIQAGASLGAGVLVVGSGIIGPNACIGSQSTLLNTSVEGKLLVPAGSVLGDRSRQIQLNTEVATPIMSPTPTIPEPKPEATPASEPSPPIATLEPTPSFQSPQSPQNGSSSFQYPQPIGIGANPFKYPEPQSLDLGQVAEQNGQPAEEKAPPYKATNIVHGQAYVHDLLSTLLPNRKRPESTSSD
jgi:carbon dioxide concentrating mechanism protein CcmN